MKFTFCLFHRGNFFMIIVSSPSRTMFMISGEIVPPCGVPLFVGNRRFCSMYPDFNHFLRMVLLMGIFFNIQSCRMLSKHPLISASKIHLADISRQRERKHCSMASLHDLRGLNPYELGSAVVSAIGSSAARWIFEADIKGCFDNIRHDWILK